MHKLIMLLSLFIFIPIGSSAMGERPKVDPECFASETLRVEIGGERFAFPREILKIAEGENIPNATGVSYPDGDDICQPNEAAPITLTKVMLEFIPNECNPAVEEYKNCSGKTVQISLEYFPRNKSKEQREVFEYLNGLKHSTRYYFPYKSLKARVQFRFKQYGFTTENKEILYDQIISPVIQKLNSFLI